MIQSYISTMWWWGWALTDPGSGWGQQFNASPHEIISDNLIFKTNEDTGFSLCAGSNDREGKACHSSGCAGFMYLENNTFHMEKEPSQGRAVYSG